MRVVLDTNVLVSAALKRQSTPGSAAHIVEMSHNLLKSSGTERQLLEVVARPHLALALPDDTVAWLRGLIAAAEFVDIIEHIVACRDPTDDKFLELAVSGRADVIVSGDRDLLALNPFRNIPIITPAAFVQSVMR